MQISRVPAASLEIANPYSRLTFIDLALGGLGSRIGDVRRAGSALLAPAAMLLGALGLVGSWAAAPKGDVWTHAGEPTPLVAATPRQADAVTTAAVRNDQALVHLLADLGGSTPLTASAPVALNATAAQTVASLREAEAHLVSAADLDAQAQLREMRATFRSTGLDARPYMAASNATAAISPLELRDVRVLSARLDVDRNIARQVQRTARDLIAARVLAGVAASLPLSSPVDHPVRSSPFGARTDPFTGAAAFHPGQDFSGRSGEPIHVTAPGVVSFAGQRAGYGNCVEVDHGYGFKTRYGHLSGFAAGLGQAVKTGDVVGLMGSTGRSTGVHLHYEVWASGQVQDPAHFLKLGVGGVKG